MSEKLRPINKAVKNIKADQLFYQICDDIARLTPKNYIQLKQWLIFQPNVSDWQALMKS